MLYIDKYAEDVIICRIKKLCCVLSRFPKRLLYVDVGKAGSSLAKEIDQTFLSPLFHLLSAAPTYSTGRLDSCMSPT